MPGLRPDQVQNLHDLIHERQILQAIKVYREATGVSLAEAKQAIEKMARNEFTKPSSEMQRSNDPIMDNKIRAMLTRGKKVEAVKIYREEHGIGLKEAKDYVDQVESSMRRENPSMGMPYQSAISGDPFADSESGRQRIVITAVAIAVAICGAGIFFLLVNI